MKNKSEKLAEKVVELVKESVNREGGISHKDILLLFGLEHQTLVAAKLAKLPISFSSPEGE